MQDQFVQQVQDISDYAGDAVPVADLRHAASASLGLIIDAISGKQHYPRMLSFASNIGTRRARQGLSADALMSAVRLDFPVIWSTLLEMAEPEDALLLATRVEEVWRVVDDYAESTRSAYIDTRIRMAQEETAVRQEFISALFGAQGRLVETRDRFAKAFGISIDATFAIAAATGRGAVQLRQLTAFPSGRTAVFLHEAEDYTYAFWPEAGHDTGGARGRPPAIDSIACGLALTSGGLAGLAAAARVAAALSVLSGPRASVPKTVDSDWPRLARSRMDAIGVELGAVLDNQLTEARTEEVDRMRETILCFLQNGSISATATELYCHRNTVLNRLRRFREITGLDMTVPAEAARIVIAWS
ncbi:helix-turn-helix domain-containing protein [Arthrobacter sp. Sr33]